MDYMSRSTEDGVNTVGCVMFVIAIAAVIALIATSIRGGDDSAVAHAAAKQQAHASCSGVWNEGVVNGQDSYWCSYTGGR